MFKQLKTIYILLFTIGILNVIALSGFYIGANNLEKLKREQISNKKELKEILLTQGYEISNIDIELNRIKQELQIEIQEIDKKTSEKFIKEKVVQEEEQRLIEKRLDSQISKLEKNLAESVYNLRNTVNEWSKRIAFIECSFAVNNFSSIKTFGSGTALFTNGVNILTNKHILISNELYPNSCKVKFTSDGVIYIIDKNDFTIPINDNDFGLINIKNPKLNLTKLVNSPAPICANKASIGDPIVILGYPNIGSQTDITATEGIISGYDGNFYITSAKVEQGNSGGAAVLIKENCFLGIPTLAKIGMVESLARIFDIRIILGQ